MKTLKVLGLVLSLSGCIYAGNISFWPERDSFVAGLSSYDIDYLDEDGPRLIKTETVTDSNFAPNKMLTAYKGYSIADTKSYTRNYYTQESIVAPKDASFVSGLSPILIEAKKKYDVIGRVEIDDVAYALVPNPDGKDVFLVANDGKPLNRVGIIRSDKLKLLDTKYQITPENFRFEPVTTSKIVQSEMSWGFEIKYAGVKLNRIVFTVMEYDQTDGQSGEFVNYNYPNRPGEIDIRGIKIRVFEANDAKIEYMIVVD